MMPLFTKAISNLECISVLIVPCLFTKLAEDYIPLIIPHNDTWICFFLESISTNNLLTPYFDWEPYINNLSAYSIALQN